MFGGGFNEVAFNTGSGENIIDMSAHLSGGGQMYTKRNVVTEKKATGLNLVAFNSAETPQESEYELNYSMVMAVVSELSGEAQMNGNFTREYAVEVQTMSGEAQMSGDFVREISMITQMSGEARIDAQASRYHVDFIEFEDAFHPGDQIIIDSGKFKITRNGQNVAHLYSGDFLQLNLGTNTLKWTDPETQRTVLFRITHRDRFLY